MVLWLNLVKRRGKEGLFCSQPTRIGVMKLSSWGSLSTCPMTATDRWMTVHGGKVDPWYQCRL